MSEPNERLQDARERAGYANATDAARAFGWNDITYRAHENGGRGLKAAVAQKYAAAFHVSAAWLLTGEGTGTTLAPYSEVKPSPIKPEAVPVTGRTEAGAFRELVEYDDDEADYVFVEPDKEFPKARRFAADVHGDSMDQATPPILPGARVVLVDFEETGLAPEEGMIVLVERTRDGGQTREWSLKMVRIFDDRMEFHPQSSKKTKHKPIVVKDDPDADEGESVQIIGLLRGVNYEVHRPRRAPKR